MYDLNALVVSELGGIGLTEATGINDRGQIVANSCNEFGPTICFAFRLDPVPTSTIPTLSQWALVVMAILLLPAGCSGDERKTKQGVPT